MARFKKVGKSKIIKKLIDMRIDNVKGIYEEFITPHYEKEKSFIEKVESDNEEYLEYLADDLAVLNKQVTDLSILACLFLYSCIETFINILGRNIDRNWRSGYRWNKINMLYKDNGIDLEQTQEYEQLYVLRLINNCFKHADNKASKELQTASKNSYREGEEIVIKGSDVLFFCDSAREYLYAIVDRADKLGRLLKITITELTQDDCNTILTDYINRHRDMDARNRVKDAFSSEYENFIHHKKTITLPLAERIYYKIAVDAYDCLIVGVNPSPAPDIVSISSVIRTTEETKGQAVFCLRELIEKKLVPMCRQMKKRIINSKAITPGSVKIFNELAGMDMRGVTSTISGDFFHAEVL